MNPLDPYLGKTRIAYFTMEIALRPEIHTYSGGLGVLAGDTARSCADLALSVVFVSLVSRAGYLRQEIDRHGRQMDLPDPWEPLEWTQPLDAMVAVSIEGRTVWIRPWLYSLSCPLGPSVPVLLLDTDLDQNDPRDRQLTDRLYGGDDVYRLKQEVVLGIGGVRLLKALGFDITTFHLNEGHAALLTLELLHQCRRSPERLRSGEPVYDHAEVRERCVFTTHTPVAAGHDQFPYDLVSRVLGDFIELDEIRVAGGPEQLNMTQLALNLSGYINGVAKRHAETTRRAYPGYDIRAVTNGVHVPTWTHPSFARVYEAHFPHWGHEPEALVKADQLPDDLVWDTHQKAKADLITRVKADCGVALQPDVLTIGFARRMTGYKRPDLLFADVERLLAMAEKYPLQVVFAGKAHPKDDDGKRLIERVNNHISDLSDRVTMAFLPNYDLSIAATLVAGSDIWLNTPLPPLEASGTSGMKAALNGVLNLSVRDGWWAEACIEGVTGWAIDGTAEANADADADALYGKLSEQVLPLFYNDRDHWIWMMKQAISKIGSYFNSQRMVRRYATEAYLR
ncbi:alpha-glucan family phosphorylase [Methyloceanibacter sp.]|uniref:alpha-glucan family phosphorylase n=1 Tax=Methyloceanibacter sp. TaxID=1965321 RepID=UPI002C49E17A|nr:alpha-glucan family phosphorylase [Methyloceanibacter sp.]HML93291.1 alpha-glucan family phosphorylase [Methyloceanibacter sp.]